MTNVFESPMKWKKIEIDFKVYKVAETADGMERTPGLKFHTN